MPLDLGSMSGVHPDTRDVLQRAQRYVNQLEAKIVAMEKFGKSPAQLSAKQLQQVQQALSSTGTHPLNITGLTGKPTPP
jgi:hypothetical protein